MIPQIHFALLTACILACTAGCNDTNRSKIVGTWTIEQADRLMSRVNASVDESESKDPTMEMEGDSEGPASKMTLVFQSNGTMKTQTSMGSVAQEKIGRWRMLGFDPESNLMKIECDLQRQTTEHDISFVDDNTIKLVPPNMAGLKMKVAFVRN